MFDEQMKLRDGLPFDVVIPSETTRETMEKTDAGRDLVVCKDADDMFKKVSGGYPDTRAGRESKIL